MTAHGYDGGQSQKAIDWLSNAARPDVWRLAGAAIFGSVAHVFAILLAGATGLLLARAMGQSPVLYMTVALVLVRAFGLGSAGLRYAAEIFGQDAGFRVMSRTRVQVYVDLERAGPSGTGRLRGGDLLVRIMNDVEAVHSLLVKGILPMAVAALTGLAAMIGLGIMVPLAGVVLLFGLLIAGLAAPIATLAAAGAAEQRLGPAREELAAPAVELLSGAAELKAFRASDRWMERIHACDATLTRLARRTAAGSGIGSGVAMLALGTTVVLELVVGLASGVPGWWLPVLVLVPIAVFEVTAGIPVAAQQVRQGLDAADRLRELEELPRPPAAGGTVPLPEGPLRLDVDDLSVRWPGSPSSALKGVTLDLRPGRRIAIVGESGAGKTTLITAILGFLPAETGQILLGGTDLADLDEDSLREAVAVCAQDAHIFDTSIRNNLLLARPEATLHEMANSLRKARLWEWVEGLPLGLDTPVGERGVRLSGGERQRLTLARALLADPRVLLLDEPTAHLDEPTAAALMRDLLVATAGRTTLLVTHRLAGLSVVDEVLVLADGFVVQRGSPTELMEAPGPYRKMWFRSAASASSLTGLPVR